MTRLQVLLEPRIGFGQIMGQAESVGEVCMAELRPEPSRGSGDRLQVLDQSMPPIQTGGRRVCIQIRNR